MKTSFPPSMINRLLGRVSAGLQWAIGLLCLAGVLLGVARIRAETMRVAVDAVAPEGHRFQPHNQDTWLVTLKDNICAVSYDSARRPYIYKVPEGTGRCERAPLDRKRKRAGSAKQNNESRDDPRQVSICAFHAGISSVFQWGRRGGRIP